MREVLKRKVAGASLAVISTLGLTACGPFGHNPNSLTECPSYWEDSSIDDAGMIVTDMPKMMARMEVGRTRLIADIHQWLGSNDNEVTVGDMPAKYRVAAGLLIGKTNEYWYDTDKAKLDTLHDEFCKDGLGDVYKSPTYVNAEAALQAADISMKPGDPK